MKCPKCGGDKMRMQVQATVSAPARLFHNLSKANLRHRDCFLMGVNWETADFICDNPRCKYVLPGYGNYVSKLEKRVAELERQLGRKGNHREGCFKKKNLP